jgi:hypothetical protein
VQNVEPFSMEPNGVFGNHKIENTILLYMKTHPDI